MLAKLDYGVIHVRRLYICNQILHIVNISVDIWFSQMLMSDYDNLND